MSNPLDPGGFQEDLFSGSSSGGPTYGKKGKKQLNLNALFPILMQSFYANAALGNDPIAFLNSFKVDKKAFKDAAKSGSDSGFLHIGGSYYDMGALTKAVSGLLQQQEDKKIADFGKTYEKLKGTPQFAGIFNEASGGYSGDADLNKAYEQMAGSALGVGAKSGFLLDPNKQAELLGPLALQKAQYLKAVQKNAEAQALGYSGAGFLPQSSPVGLLGVGSAQSYAPGIFNAAGLGQAQEQFEAQLGFQKEAADKDLYGGLAGAGIGALAFLCWVADELWGEDDPRTHAARLWASTHDTPFTRTYRKHGRAWAAWLHDNAWARPLVEPIWLAMARRGAAQAAGMVA